MIYDEEWERRLLTDISMCWTKETSATPDVWTRMNPAIGQCAVTALVIQEYLGGELIRGMVGTTSHYWNRLASGREIDITARQFGPYWETVGAEVRMREYVLSFPDTRERYRILKGAVTRRRLGGWSYV